MFESEADVIAQVVARLRRPVVMDPALDGRVMETIARLPAPRPGGAARAAWRWLVRPRAFTLSPLGGLVIAAGVAALIVALPGRRLAPRPTGASRALGFVVVAPHAGRVALVGDFNDWDAARTPMSRSDAAGSVWTAVLPLAPGRYRYAFLVDGTRWLADPAAPVASDDEFGTPSSVVTVAGAGGEGGGT